MLWRLGLLLSVVPALAGAEPVDRLPAWLLQVPDSVTTVLIAETDESTLHRLSNGRDGVGYVDGRYMSVGRNGVGKRRAWDRRTPLGIYFVSEQLDTANLHERYGPAAFPLDYPNAWDRQHRRGGDGIWIHGVTEGGGRRPPRDTDGCIALPNDELLQLAPLLSPNVTPVLVARKLRWADAAEIGEVRGALAAALDEWAAAVRDGDLRRYLSLYAADFAWRGLDRDEWAALRAQTLRRSPELRLEEVLLLQDPEEETLYLSRFRQSRREGGREVVTLKRIYWRRTAAGFEIVAEDNG